MKVLPILSPRDMVQRVMCGHTCPGALSGPQPLFFELRQFCSRLSVRYSKSTRFGPAISCQRIIIASVPHGTYHPDTPGNNFMQTPARLSLWSLTQHPHVTT